MVSTYISAVNQKLLFARQLLQMVESAGITSVSSHQAAAVTQSVVVQLHQAWLWHCRNVAESYKLKEVELVTDGDSLVALLAQQKQVPWGRLQSCNSCRMNPDPGSVSYSMPIVIFIFYLLFAKRKWTLIACR